MGWSSASDMQQPYGWPRDDDGAAHSSGVIRIDAKPCSCFRFWRGSRPPGEGVLVAGQLGHRVGGVVGAGVVLGTRSGCRRLVFTTQAPGSRGGRGSGRVASRTARAAAALVHGREGDALGVGGGRRSWRPRSSTCAVGPRTAGMIPAWHARLRARAAEMGWPVSTCAVLRPPIRDSRRHRDDEGGVDAAGLGEPVGGVALDELGERLSHPLRARAAFAERTQRGLVFGGGERQERLLSMAPSEGVEGEPAVHLAVSVLPHREPGVGGGLAFFSVRGVWRCGRRRSGGGDLDQCRPRILGVLAS